MEKIKVYVDACILSAISRLDWEDVDRDALDTLCDLDNIDLTTSRKSLDEFLNYKGRDLRVALKLIYKIINKTPSRPSLSYSGGWGSAPWGTMSWGGGSTQDIKRTKLREIFDLIDADHIYEASESNCQYFLTLDRKTILKRYSKRKTEVDSLIGNMRIVSPTDLLKNFK